MRDTIVVTVLVENTAHGRGLMAEHGLAFHIQAGTDSLLFDTGQSALLVHNARCLGVDLSRLGAMALSHGHYDHSGGLRAVWELAPSTPLYAHPGVLAARFAHNPEGGARAGVVNTLRHVRRLTNDRPIHAVLGGMHPLTAAPERIMRTVEALRALGVKRLGPAHCTGATATARLWNEFPSACTVCSVGSRFVFQR